MTVRARGFHRSVGWLLLAVALGTPLHAAAQDAQRRAVPRSLRDGAPARRFAGKAVRPPSQQAAPRPPAGPGIVLDRAELLGRAAMERRSMSLLQREISVLQRLLLNSRTQDPRRADVLLRLAYAYQELMFQQKLRIHRLRETHGQECRCSLPDASASAVACGEPAARAPVVAAR